MNDPNKKAILKLLESLLHGHHRWQVFDDFATLSEVYLRMLPEHAESIATTGNPAADDDATKALCLDLGKRYGKDYSILVQAVTVLAMAADDTLTDGPTDILGHLYEEFEVTNSARGQYFTPLEICRMMARQMLTDGLALIAERIIAAVGPDVAALYDLSPDRPETLRYVAENILPHCIDRYEAVSVCDPACGSGRFLLAAAECFPQWATRLGLVQFYGQDVDHTCALMARANMMLNGLNGWGLKYHRAGCQLQLTNPAHPGVTNPPFGAAA